MRREKRTSSVTVTIPTLDRNVCEVCRAVKWPENDAARVVAAAASFSGQWSGHLTDGSLPCTCGNTGRYLTASAKMTAPTVTRARLRVTSEKDGTYTGPVKSHRPKTRDVQPVEDAARHDQRRRSEEGVLMGAHTGLRHQQGRHDHAQPNLNPEERRIAVGREEQAPACRARPRQPA